MNLGKWSGREIHQSHKERRIKEIRESEKRLKIGWRKN